MTKTITSFDISNDTEKPLTIVHEPECFEFNLPPNEFVTIEVISCISSALLRHFLDNERIAISIVSENSLYRVKYHGLDVFSKYYDN